MKRILIVDDSALIRSTLRTLLAKRSDWAICGEAENGSDGIDKAQKLHPDLIVMDLVMPVLNGIDATRLLKRLMPATPIVMFTTFADMHIKNAALAAGVRTVVDKTDGTATLINSIQESFVAELSPSCAA